jgi:hypothetical protein
MCSSQTQSFIDQVVSDKVNSNTMFTLFDVTLEVKELQKSSGLPVSRHSEIHDDVRQSANATGWGRTLRPMGGNMQAFVYFNSQSHDPSIYTPLPRKDAPASVNGVHPAALAFAGTTTDDDDDDDDYKQLATTKVDNGLKAPDRWGRLRIPSGTMRLSGFGPGDVVFVAVKNNDELSITKASTVAPTARYIVDCHANVRLTPRTLKAANLLGKPAYKLVANSGEVVVG